MKHRATVLRRRQFGDPILREKARAIPVVDITSGKIQHLIADMRHTLLEKKLGVAMAAPQIGESLALAVVAVRPLAHRHKVEPFDLVLINPEITKKVGRRKILWEGCVSSGRGGRADLFAKVPRYLEVKVKYYDEHGRQNHKTFSDFRAQIVQHEIDHLNGILFVDRVKDTKTYATYKEYMRMVRSRLAQ